jgi:hypothetical protein
MTTIDDGTGTGNSAKVRQDNRLNVYAITETASHNQSADGDAYNVNTGSVVLTGDGNTSAVFYLKNTGSVDLVIPTFFYLVGASTGGSGDYIITIVRNPTGGTIVSTETGVDMNQNRNFSSTKILPATTYKGFEGATLTGGSDIISSIFTSPTRAAIGVGGVVLGAQNSIGVNITTQSGNSSMSIMIATEIYKDSDL